MKLNIIERKRTGRGVGMGALMVLAAAGIFTGVTFYPEVRRYLRMKRM